MKLIFTKDLQENIYSAEVKTELVAQEQLLSQKFGEPQINFGGTIPGPPEFELADIYKKIYSEMPYILEIDANGDPEAKSKILAWIAEIRTRMLASIASLRFNIDDYTGESIETI